MLTTTAPHRSRRRRWPWVLLGAVVVLLGAAAVAAVVAWPSATIGISEDGLPQVSAPRFAGDLVSVAVHSADGTPVPVTVGRDGTLTPTRRVVAGAPLVAEAVVRRPGWIGWLAGRKQSVRTTIDAPTAQLEATRLRLRPGAPVQVSFDRPVREVRAGSKTIRLEQPARTVTLGRLGPAGAVPVSAVALAWEKLPQPTTVTWFPTGKASMLLVSPTRSTELDPTAPLELHFSNPVRGPMPTLRPEVRGSWRRPDPYTLTFTPRGYGFGLDGRVRLTLSAPAVVMGGAGKPVRKIVWATPKPDPLRLEQMLALLRYLPLRWVADDADAPRTVTGQLEAASDPPRGRFSWRYPDTPPELTQLWLPGRFNSIDRGAVMAFQNEHHLTVDGFAGHDVWQALIADAIAGKPRKDDYSYVFVHSAVPTSLNLWHAGRVILTSPGNTGIPAAPTELGTFPVFEHIPVGRMSGTNPDGSHYDDPGVRWISYFNHGSGIHAFNRASFGTPQSLGCVELPLEAAARVWPYTPIGTLVTIEH